MTNKNYKEINDIDSAVTQWLTGMDIQISLRSEDIVHDERVLTIEDVSAYRVDEIE